MTELLNSHKVVTASLKYDRCGLVVRALTDDQKAMSKNPDII
jgi:hypothetical protein